MAVQAVVKTLDDIINANNRYNINKLTLYKPTLDETLLIQDTTLFRMYMRFINQYIMRYRISDQQRAYYRYKPGLLSQDIYGTPELAWMIMQINDQECPSKFRLKSTVRLIDPETLSSIYDFVLTKSNDKLNANWNKYLVDVVVEDDSVQ